MIRYIFVLMSMLLLSGCYITDQPLFGEDGEKTPLTVGQYLCPYEEKTDRPMTVRYVPDGAKHHYVFTMDEDYDQNVPDLAVLRGTRAFYHVAKDIYVSSSIPDLKGSAGESRQDYMNQIARITERKIEYVKFVEMRRGNQPPVEMALAILNNVELAYGRAESSGLVSLSGSLDDMRAFVRAIAERIAAERGADVKGYGSCTLRE
ncbi:MAG: hypothetical protein KBE09_05595 [Candidatus Pacebacteria bacterium]|nr:hypothetical protein [Candidatus Paceibacterota bacterium]